jgi:hypothetical protein
MLLDLDSQRLHGAQRRTPRRRHAERNSVMMQQAMETSNEWMRTEL